MLRPQLDLHFRDYCRNHFFHPFKSRLIELRRSATNRNCPDDIAHCPLCGECACCSANNLPNRCNAATFELAACLTVSDTSHAQRLPQWPTGSQHAAFSRCQPVTGCDFSAGRDFFCLTLSQSRGIRGKAHWCLFESSCAQWVPRLAWTGFLVTHQHFQSASHE